MAKKFFTLKLDKYRHLFKNRQLVQTGNINLFKKTHSLDKGFVVSWQMVRVKDIWTLHN